MTWDQAMEIVVRRTHHERYRWLTSDDNPDVMQRDGYRRLMVLKAAEKVEYPPRLTQAKTAMRAAVRWARSGFRIVSWRERQRRMEICKACPLFDAARIRCTVCGCSGLAKPWLATEVCPKGYWVTGLPASPGCSLALGPGSPGK
jgi:hypothetical protein